MALPLLAIQSLNMGRSCDNCKHPRMLTSSRVKFEALIVAQTILQDNNIKDTNTFPKFKNYIIYLCVYMLMGHRLHVEVKGQFEGVGSLLHHESWGWDSGHQA